MRTFYLKRLKDISGTSGTGIVAEGVEFWNGECVMCWRGDKSSIAVYKSIESILEIHGHGGATKIVFKRRTSK